MTPKYIAEEFNLSVDSVMSSKCRRKITYKELYDDYVDRLITIKECQDMCIDIYASKIQHLFNSNITKHNNSSARAFLLNLYSPVNMPRSQKVKRCKQIIQYLKENR